ncbi:MAG: hypothetical protein Q9222_005469 [Ikaeria aurantiellina]
MLSDKCELPIFTLNVLNSKIYVITSPDLISAVNRNSKALALNPFIAQLGKRITGHDEVTSRIVQHNLNGEEGPGYVIDVHDRIVTALSPGHNLEDMTKVMLDQAWHYLDGVAAGKEIDLFAWTKEIVTICSTRAIYGPTNPFNKYPEFARQFWDFDYDLNMLIADIFPSLLARAGHKARSDIAAAYADYFRHYEPGQTQSSAMTRARYLTNTQYGLTPWNQGCLEVGSLLGILANTIPSSFYMLVRLYTNPDLLKDVRAELESAAVERSDEGNLIIKILAVREFCPLLYATWQELLRLHALGVGSRYVREDVLLNDQYLLEKGRVVQMPMAVLHTNPAVWGSDAHEFRPRRFLKQSGDVKGPRTNLPAYRPFGGGASMCPGRHFVAFEVLALAACMILRFDVSPVEGKWRIPAQKQESLATNVFPPEKDMRVRISAREGYKKVKWSFEMK